MDKEKEISIQRINTSNQFNILFCGPHDADILPQTFGCVVLLFRVNPQ